MDEQKAAAALAEAEQYREIARKLRGIAQECRFAEGRQELLDLAVRYEGTADHLDPRSPSGYLSGQALATGRCAD